MRYISFFSLVFFLFFSCDSVENSKSPIISNFIIEDDSLKILAGSLLQFEISFEDDNGLQQYRVRIEDSFEDTRLLSALWEYEKDFDLAGTVYTTSHSIDMPYYDIEPGRYKLDVIVQDVDLNETPLSQYFYVYK